MCSHHDLPVVLADGDVWIRHRDGGYCDSQQFTIGSLTRGQVMALLLVDRGEKLMAATVTQPGARG